MAKVELTTEEAQLVAVYRAIKDFDQEHLVSTADTSTVLSALRSIVDFDQLEEDLSRTELKSVLHGFVAGIAVTNSVPQYSSYEEALESQEPSYGYPDVDDSETIVGGATGGVVAGQVSGNPNYVTQTGVREDNTDNAGKPPSPSSD